MQIPYIKSRDFDSPAIGLKAMDVDEVHVYLTGYVHGYAQALSDALHKHFPHFVKLHITSSNRMNYNQTVPNAAKDSHHIWRLEPDGALHTAFDSYAEGLTLDELFNFAVANCRGEIYLNREQKIVHIAPVPMEEQHWIQ